MKNLSLAFFTGLIGVFSVSAQTTFNINPKVRMQQIDCFGASDAWSMQFVGLMDESVQNRVADWLFGSEFDKKGNPMGIGLSIWRFNIGAGSSEQGKASKINFSTRTECLRDSNGQFDWSKQIGQRKFLKLAKERGVERFLGFLNSPPVYFTQNGLATNTGRGGTFNLREDKYQAFTRFIADVVEGLEKHDGITLDYVAPVNEPDGHWNWQGPKQEGTPATNEEVARVARLLDDEFEQRNMSTGIIIPESSDYRCMMGEHMAGNERGYEIQSFFCADSTDTYVGNLKRINNLIVGHSYWTNTPVPAMKAFREQLRDTLKKYGVDFWQTEVCIMGNDEEIGGGGGYDRTMKTALYVARVIHYDLVYANARSWQWWRAIGGDYKDGLLFQYKDKHTDNDTIVDSKLLWTLGNYSRFIRPGATRVEVTASDNGGKLCADAASDPYGLMCSAYVNADGKMTIVMINYSEESQAASIKIEPSHGVYLGKWSVFRTSDIEGESLKRIEHNISTVRLARMQFPPRSVTTIISVK